MLANSHQKNTVTSKLYNQTSFYSALANDMLKAKEEIIIYSPFVSKHRTDTFLRLLDKLKDTNINVFIFTRPLREYAPGQRSEITEILGQYEETGATIYYLSGYIHEKVAIIDREILWEGSLNILSQRSCREMMRRIT
ncbi:MAG TPA: phospholipase D-like domain-containing protein, partial [Patescibacteria group bacterium]